MSQTSDAAPETGAAPEERPAESGVDLERVRALVLQAHPDVVPEMVAGETFEALMASVEPARAAYRRIAETVRGQAAPPPVPAGQPGRRIAADVGALSPSAKIAAGLRARAKR